jgi:hypothetical protein
LADNEIGDEGIQYLAEALQHHSVLVNSQRLSIFTRFREQTLTLLDLQNNGIGDQGAKYIADALRNNTVSSICLSLAFDLHSTCRFFKNLIYDQTISQKREQNIYTTHCAITRFLFSTSLLLLFDDYFFTQTLTKLYLTNNNSAHCDALETVISMKNKKVIENSISFPIYPCDYDIVQVPECIILRRERLGNTGVRYLVGILRNDTVSVSHDQ